MTTILPTQESEENRGCSTPRKEFAPVADVRPVKKCQCLTEATGNDSIYEPGFKLIRVRIRFLPVKEYEFKKLQLEQIWGFLSS